MEMVGSRGPIHLLANMVNGRARWRLIVVGLFIGSSAIVYYAGIKPVISRHSDCRFPWLRDRVHPVRLDLCSTSTSTSKDAIRRSGDGRLALRVACVAARLLAFVFQVRLRSYLRLQLHFAFPDYSMGHGFLLNNQTSCPIRFHSPKIWTH